MNSTYILICIFLMFLVTYLPRVLPIVLFRKKLEDGFLKSFLLYMPYGILAAMVFPEVFTSTPSFLSAVAGVIVAVVVSLMNKGLFPAAVSAVLAVFLVNLFSV